MALMSTFQSSSFALFIFFLLCSCWPFTSYFFFSQSSLLQQLTPLHIDLSPSVFLHILIHKYGQADRCWSHCPAFAEMHLKISGWLPRAHFCWLSFTVTNLSSLKQTHMDSSPVMSPPRQRRDSDRYCQLCTAWFNNPMMAQQHYDGKKHKKNAARADLLEQLGKTLDLGELRGKCLWWSRSINIKNCSCFEICSCCVTSKALEIETTIWGWISPLNL